MSQAPSITTTGRRGGSSAGVSATGCTRRWVPNPFDGWTQTQGVVESFPTPAEWWEEGNGFHVADGSFVLAQQTVGRQETFDSWRLRYLCSRLMEEIPERGLEELYECLNR